MIYLLDVNVWSLWASLIMNSTVVLLLECNPKMCRTWRVAQSPSSDLYACWPKPRLTDLA
jgi:hypothetical protein